ncbi:acyltransferase family protein [Catellatospora sichuanensis]|uniref:acyltransferase family protein n=1 Tax=Catellatospora sichuanensis TaxID=1969805 RepID=UPI001181EAF8|nr:acyltransferase family protein [Catellatospora sichuanensis]
MGDGQDTTAPAGAAVQRRPELDAIRTLVVVGLVFFHSALVFDARDDYYVKNADTTEVTTILSGLAVVWAMPALFLIAGFGARHSLRRRGPGRFAAERLRRLGVPLLFALVALLPVPQWLRLKAADPGYHESYWRFLPRFFDVRFEPGEFPFVLQGEHFETGHLWFVVLLLAWALLLAGAARVLPADRMRRLRDRLAASIGHRGMVLLLPALPLALISALDGMEEGLAGWSRWAYLLFFAYGFVLATDERFRDAMRRDAVLAAVAGVVLMAVGMPLFFMISQGGGDPFTDLTRPALTMRALYGMTGWCWVVAILGLLDRRQVARRERRPAAGAVAAPTHAEAGDGQPDLTRRSYLYLALGALPVYVLHQPIVVAVAYGVVSWQAPIAVKYAALVAIAIVLTVAAYDLLVRRTRITRFLFGMREPAAVRPNTTDRPGE